MIPVTDRELSNAWRSHLQVASGGASISHRLLLFYAVECGLKSLLLRRLGRTHSEACQEIINAGHSVNGLLDVLKAGAGLRINPSTIKLRRIVIDGKDCARAGSHSQINEIWRYGMTAVDPNDEHLEKQLIRISKWIQEQVR